MPLNIGTAELVEELVELKDLIKKDEDENAEHHTYDPYIQEQLEVGNNLEIEQPYTNRAIGKSDKSQKSTDDINRQ